MAALSALKVGGGSPNVCFAALRPSTKNFDQSASRQKNMYCTRDAPNQPPNRTMSSSNYL